MNIDNKIGILSISEIAGMDFSIPKYQRGYRWEEQQVKELLDDLYKFMQSPRGFYCLQPLVVKRISKNEFEFKKQVCEILENGSNSIDELNSLISRNTQWEVIDGQQRLTTIFIILKCLGVEHPFNVCYETRQDSANFLYYICDKSEDEADLNIDYKRMYAAYKCTNKWLEDKDEQCRSHLLQIVNSQVKFIWYESINENAISVFTRLNIGKIALTNAELIKAMLLNKSNFIHISNELFRARQLEIANKWDEIEYTLQNDEVWLFLNSAKYDRPTRIDYIFEIIQDQDLFNLKSGDKLGQKYDEVIGNDRFSVYRYLGAAINQDDTVDVLPRLEEVWETITSIFDTFMEWYNDPKLYHYIGFLIWVNEKSNGNKFKLITELYRNWIENDKVTFFEGQSGVNDNTCIKQRIKNVINCTEDKINALHFEHNKENIQSILVLHNIQTIISEQEDQTDKYKLHVFYKFPFHLFKRETWNVEHIDSATTNELKRTKEKKSWARAALVTLNGKMGTENLKLRLKGLISLKDKDEYDGFKELYDDYISLFPNEDALKVPQESDEDQDNERMHTWNLALLDESTNKSYKNSIFSVKRSFVIFKEQGKHCRLNDDGNVESDGTYSLAFVPPCTKHVFMKYYTKNANDLLIWGRKDSENYLNDIKSKLKPFLKQ